MLYIAFLGARQEQDIFVRLIDSVTKQVSSKIFQLVIDDLIINGAIASNGTYILYIYFIFIY